MRMQGGYLAGADAPLLGNLEDDAEEEGEGQGEEEGQAGKNSSSSSSSSSSEDFYDAEPALEQSGKGPS